MGMGMAVGVGGIGVGTTFVTTFAAETMAGLISKVESTAREVVSFFMRS